MPKKAERLIKPAKSEKGDRWTVRGVPARLQKAAGDAARARGLTLGRWLSDVLVSATARSVRQPTNGSTLDDSIEQRLARLEAEVFSQQGPAASARGSRHPAA